MRTHVSLNVTDIAQSVEFYSKVFGKAPQKQVLEYAKFDLEQPPLNFSLLKASAQRPRSCVNHLGIEVESAEEVRSWQKRLAAMQLIVLPEENANCCYARQDKFWFTDPDGNAWEVFFVHEQLPTIAAEPPQDKSLGKSGSVSGCC